MIKARFPNAKVENMKLQFSTDPKKPFEIVVKGPKGGQTKVFLDDGSGFQKKFLNTTFIKKSLGESFEELSRKESQSIYEETQNLLKDEVSLKDAEAEKKKQIEANSARRETERIRSEFISRQEEIIRRGESSEKDEEIRRLKEAKKELKLLQELDKKDKEKMKKQEKIIEKLKADIDKGMSSLSKRKSEYAAKETRFYNTQPLENIKEREEELRQKKPKGPGNNPR